MNDIRKQDKHLEIDELQAVISIKEKVKGTFREEHFM